MRITRISDVLEAGSAKIATTVSVSVKDCLRSFGSHTLNIAEPVQESRGRQTVKAKFHYAILVADRFEAGRRPDSSLLVTGQIPARCRSATSFGPVCDQDSVMEFGFYYTSLIGRVIHRLSNGDISDSLEYRLSFFSPIANLFKMRSFMYRDLSLPLLCLHQGLAKFLVGPNCRRQSSANRSRPNG